MESLRAVIDNLNLNWVFFVVVGILLAGVIIGYLKGVLKMIFFVISVFLAIFFTIVLSPITRSWLFKSDKLYNFVYARMESLIENNGWAEIIAEKIAGDGTDTETGGEESVNTAREILSALGIPESMQESILGDESALAKLEMSSDAEVNDRLIAAENGTCTGITNVIIKALAFLLTLLIVGILIAIVSGTLNLLGKIPGVGSVNKIVGGLIGGCAALLVVWVLFGIVTMFGATAVGQEILAKISENPVLSFIYDHSIISARILS